MKTTMKCINNLKTVGVFSGFLLSLLLSFNVVYGVPPKQKTIEISVPPKMSEINVKYIAHALGAVDGIAETNSLEAMQQSYDSGFRVFEVDLNLTTDGNLAAVHDWESYSNPMTSEKWLEKKLAYKYTSMIIDNICEFMSEHKDVYIVTDTKIFEDESKITQQFQILKNKAEHYGVIERIVPQIYNRRMYEVIN
ncbi:MAG: hypothetical protein LBM16_02485 [Clostridiales bacterium]|nr:hypothetical protein [Clostridiales bacterium]